MNEPEAMNEPELENGTELIREPERFWFALYTKPKNEFQAELQLRAIGIETYMPFVIKEKKWTDRIKKTKEPVFRGYIFILATIQERYQAVTQKGIVKAVSFGSVVSTIPDWQIQNLKIILSDNPEYYISDKLLLGTKVRIMDGPFKDIEGIITTERGKGKVLGVTIDILKRSVVISLPENYVMKTPNQAVPVKDNKKYYYKVIEEEDESEGTQTGVTMASNSDEPESEDTKPTATRDSESEETRTIIPKNSESVETKSSTPEGSESEDSEKNKNN
ncbi:MAG: UpxY family transcription antiterminator [Melioribacteraceae bacterium]|nr:UpxY family transcription antiterminator [Melioribacteraceae bacterium]